MLPDPGIRCLSDCSVELHDVVVKPRGPWEDWTFAKCISECLLVVPWSCDVSSVESRCHHLGT